MPHTESRAGGDQRYQRAASVCYLLADLKNNNPALCEKLAGLLETKKAEAEEAGLKTPNASFEGHRAVVDYIREHHPDLLSQIDGADIEEELIH